MKIGVVDVGGGLRGIYATGVLDRCQELGIAFDCCIGVSAGSANLASYLARQKGRNVRFYLDYAFRKAYMSFGNWAHTHSYIDMDYVYGTLSKADGEDPLDYPALRDNPAEFYIVATEAVSGQGKYFDKSDIHQDDYRVFSASSSIPGVNRPYNIGGTLYFDGALADPVPVEKAFALGCDKVVLILTKPAAIPRTPGKDPILAKLIRRRYPAAAKQLLKRAERYNACVQLAQEYVQQGRAFIVSPKDINGVSTLSRHREPLERLYKMGLQDGQQIADWLQ